jgi:hypothetical protein
MSTIHLLVNVTGKSEIELNIFDFGLFYNVSSVHNYINCGQYMFLAAKWVKKNCKNNDFFNLRSSFLPAYLDIPRKLISSRRRSSGLHVVAPLALSSSGSYPSALITTLLTVAAPLQHFSKCPVFPHLLHLRP